MLKIGSLVKINSTICSVFSISVPYGVIVNFRLLTNPIGVGGLITCDIRINEVDRDNDDFVFHHYILAIHITDLEEV